MAMATQLFPRYVAFQTDYWKQYLQCTFEDDKSNGFLKYSAEYVLNLKQPYTKFQIEPSQTLNFIHIRNCYNNKYWAAIFNEYDDDSVGAVAAVPNEDQSSPSCTLFELIEWTTPYDTTLLYIRHVNLDKYLYVNSSLSEKSSVYLDEKPVSEMAINQASHLIVDWELLLVLPKYIAFKGDNGKYLHTLWNDESKTYHLQFSIDDIGDSSVVFEVFYLLNGWLQFKCVEVGYYWYYKYRTYLITTAPDKKTSQSFLGKKIDNVTLALQTNMKLFCQRFSIDQTPSGIDLLSDRASSTIKETHLTVEEPVITSSKSVYNAIFDIPNSRVYNQTTKEMATAFGSNDTQNPKYVNLTLEYTDTTSSTWNTLLSFTLGAFPFSTGIPLIDDSGEVAISASKFEGSYSWGETKETSKEASSNYPVTVPPMTRVKVTLMATQAQCDVPFSYVQRYTLYNGETLMEELKDGMYQGINYYNLFFQKEEFPLDPRNISNE